MATTAPSGELVLVTGVSGFIGGYIAKELLAAGYKVRGTTRSLTNRGLDWLRLCDGAKEHLELVEATLFDEDAWLPIADGCQFVIHVATAVPAPGSSEADIIRTSVEGTIHVMKAAVASGTVRRVVYTSSVSAISTGHMRQHGDDVCKCVLNGSATLPSLEPGFECRSMFEVYGKAKATAEAAAWKYCEAHGMELVTLLPAMVVGTIMNGRLASSGGLVWSYMCNDNWFGQYEMNLSYVNVKAVAECHVKAITSKAATNKRLVLGGALLTSPQVASILDRRFRSKGFRFTTWLAGPLLTRLSFALIPEQRILKPLTGPRPRFDNAEAEEVFGIDLCEGAEQGLTDMAQSLIDYEMVQPNNVRRALPLMLAVGVAAAVYALRR